MSWAKFDDAFWSHPKVIRAGNEAVGAFVRMVCYCAQYLTDGAVPKSTAREIARPKIIEKLVEVGLLEVDGDGFRVHGYLERNPSRLQVEAERAAKTQRQNRWRESRAQEQKLAPFAEKTTSVDASTAPSQDASKDAAPSRPVPSRPENTACSLPARAPEREGLASAQPANDRPWWLDPWAVVDRLRTRSQGRINLVLNGHERALSAALVSASKGYADLGTVLDRWADLAARGEASWWQGALTIGALLGRPDETGKRTADGLLRCLEETSLRMPKAQPAKLRVVAKDEPKREVMSPERAQEIAAKMREERLAREAKRAAEEHAARVAKLEAANG